ncbi:MAG TPA: NAD(P)H-quinone oxidoreductase, partial [Polyangium sp.]|nr:NAD(P)H-quinone oxidoreductase [Polyangium sp.]
PEVLEVRDVPDVVPTFGHVRIRVTYAGVNRADLLQRAGFYPPPENTPPDIPGLEYVGTIDVVGPGVTRFKGGERVYGLVGGAAYAEYVVAHEREVALAPASLSDELAGGAPEAFVTAYDALVTRGRLQPGERVLVHAAGSGVGTAGVQIARALGCTVFGTSRTADKLERCKELGLDHGIVTTDGKFAEKIRECTSGKGVDVVLDLVGGGYVAETMIAAAKRARIVVVGLTGGASANLNLNLLLVKRIEIIGTVLRSRPLEEKIEAAKMLEGTITQWLERGMVKPVIDRVFSMSEAAAAHEYVASNVSFGKVLLDMRV